MKSLFRVNNLSVVGILSAIIFSSSAHALIINTSVSAYAQHMVNDVYTEHYLGPQNSFEESYGYPGDFSMGAGDASGFVRNRLQVDANGQNFIVSSVRNSWITEAPSTGGAVSGSYQPFSFSNDLQVYRTAHITNDSAADVHLTFDYLLNSGRMEYALPELTGNEFLSLMYMAGVVVNDHQKSWIVGANAFIGERYRSSFGDSFYLLESVIHGSQNTFTTGGDLSSDALINHWRYQWEQQQGQMDLGVLKAGETIKLDYFYRTRVRGFIEHCVPTRDSEIPIVGCIDDLGSAQIGYWNDGSSALIDESTVKAVPVPESSPMYLFALSLFGLLVARIKKNN